MKRDLSGLPKQTAIAVIEADLDSGVAWSLRQTEESLIREGADETTWEDVMTYARAELALFREQALAQTIAELNLGPPPTLH